MKTYKALCGILALIIILCCTLTGCQDKNGNYPVTVGHTIFKESPVKVVSLSDNIADIICYEGYATKLSGVSDACTQTELTEYITSVGSETSPNVDLIVSSGATIVFADTALNTEATRVLEENNIEIVNLLYPADNAQLLTVYESIGAILGGDTDGRAKGTDAYNRLMSILTSAQSEVSSAAATKTVCYLYLDENGKLKACTGAVNDGMVMSYLGVTNVAANFENGDVEESILKLSNPDYIFFDSSEVMTKLTESSTLKNLNAITKGNVFELKKEELDRQGESLAKVQNFMLSSMFPNLVDVPVESSEDISSLYGIALTEDMSFKAGDDSENVAAIQQRLVDLGYLDLGGDAPTTYFGSMSEEALKAFQEANGLEASGIASYETLKKLFDSAAKGIDGEAYVPETTAATEPATEATTINNDTDNNSENGAGQNSANVSGTYQLGDEHEDIKTIQERLVELKYLSFNEGDSPTTYYGPGTENAIKLFQESNGLTVTGVADSETLEVLFSEDAKLPQ